MSVRKARTCTCSHRGLDHAYDKKTGPGACTLCDCPGFTGPAATSRLHAWLGAVEKTLKEKTSEEA